MSKTNNSGKMTKSQLTFSSIGAALGLALATYIGYLIAYAGKAAIWTVLIGIVLATAKTLPYRSLAKRAVVAGGQYGLTAAGLGPLASAVANYMTVLTLLIYAVNPLAISTYVVSLIPALAPYSKWIGLASALLCFAIISGKVTGMGKIQTFFSTSLIIGLFAYMVFGFVYIMQNGTGDGLGIFNLSQDPIYSNAGIGGILAGIPISMPMMCMYSMMLYYGPICEEPKKNIPFAMNIAMVAIVVFWVGLTAVTANVLPVGQVAGQPLTTVAEVIMPSTLAKLFVIFGPIMAILTTYIGNMPGSMEAIANMSNEGWLPRVLCRRNKNGRPWIAALMVTLVPMIFVILEIPITTVQNMVMLTSGPSGIMLLLAFYKLPDKVPEYFASKREVVIYRAGCIISIVIDVFSFCISAKNAGIMIAIITVIIFAVLFVLCKFMKNKGMIKEVPITAYLTDYEEVKSAAQTQNS